MNTSPKKPRHRPLRHVLLLGVVAALIYLLSQQSLSGSNDGSQYALTSALATEGRFAINTYRQHTSKIDYAYRDGNYYSDRSPGTSLLAVPLYKIGSLAGIEQPHPRRTREPQPLTFVLTPLLGATGVVFLYLLLRSLQVHTSAATITALLYGFTSLHWKYSAVFMSHAPSATAVIILLYLARISPRLRNGLHLQILFFLLLGFLPLLRYECVLLVPVLGVLFLRRWRGRLRRSHLIYFLLAFLLPLSFLAYYHTSCFGTPWRTFTSFYAPDRNFWGDWQNVAMRGGGFTVASSLAHPLMEGIHRILFQFPGRPSLFVPAPIGGKGAWGLCILQPVLLFVPLGIVCLYRRMRLESCAYLVLIAALLVFSAKYLMLDGGSERDPRIMLPVLPIMFVFLGVALSEITFRRLHSRGALPFLCVVVAFGTVGAWMNIVHIAETRALPIFKMHEVPNASLISIELFSALFWAVFPRLQSLDVMAAALFVGLVVAALTLLPLFVLARRPLLFACCCGAAIAGFAILIPLRAASSSVYHDSIALNGTAASTAVQSKYWPQRLSMTGRARYALPFSRCDEGLVVAPRSHLQFDEDIFKGGQLILTGFTPSNAVSRNRRNVMRFSIYSGEARIWRSRAVAPGHRSRSVTISNLRKPTVLTVEGGSRVEGAPAVWCLKDTAGRAPIVSSIPHGAPLVRKWPAVKRKLAPTPTPTPSPAPQPVTTALRKEEKRASSMSLAPKKAPPAPPDGKRGAR